MADGYSRSRSPVRAITTAQAAWREAAAPAPNWSEPFTREFPSAGPVSGALHHPLTCPECGSGLRLSLSPTQAAAPPSPFPASSPLPAPEGVETPNFEDAIQRHKRELIRAAMEQHGGVMTKAARALGLKYTTFVAMVHRLGVVEGGDPEAAE